MSQELTEGDVRVMKGCGISGKVSLVWMSEAYATCAGQVPVKGSCCYILVYCSN